MLLLLACVHASTAQRNHDSKFVMHATLLACVGEIVHRLAVQQRAAFTTHVLTNITYFYASWHLSARILLQ